MLIVFRNFFFRNSFVLSYVVTVAFTLQRLFRHYTIIHRVSNDTKQKVQELLARSKYNALSEETVECEGLKFHSRRKLETPAIHDTTRSTFHVANTKKRGRNEISLQATEFASSLPLSRALVIARNSRINGVQSVGRDV